MLKWHLNVLETSELYFFWEYPNPVAGEVDINMDLPDVHFEAGKFFRDWEIRKTAAIGDLMKCHNSHFRKLSCSVLRRHSRSRGLL